MDTTPTTPPPPPAKPLSEIERLRQQRAKIDARLRMIASAENAAKRKAETHGKVILGALALGSPALVVQLAAKASERDRAHLSALGWLAAPTPIPVVAPSPVAPATGGITISAGVPRTP